MTAKTSDYLTRCMDCGFESEIDDFLFNHRYDAYYCPSCGSEDLEDFIESEKLSA